MIGTMVFAAGLGTRMRPLTDDRPKALVPVAGRALIEHAFEQAAGPGPLVVNAHYRADKLAAYLRGRDLTLVAEDPLLDTGGGLRNALPHLGVNPVLTMNSDAVWTGPRARATLEAHWRPESMDGLLLLVPRDRVLGEAGGASFQVDGDGRLRISSDGMAYTGAGIVKTEGLRDFPDGPFSLRDLWFSMLDAGRLHGCVHPGGWADVGTPDGIAPAEAMLRQAA